MNNILITLDIDWAPDFMIDWVSELLIAHQVKATWFVTNPSPAVERLKSCFELFELGIHPNFLPNSTQGNDPDSILEYCLNIVPDTICMRTHSLVQSTPLLTQVMKTTNIKADLSLFLLGVSHLQAFTFWSNQKALIRIPCYWEDDYEMEKPQPCWSLNKNKLENPGLKIFNFHPIHVYLNSCSMKPYNDLKKNHPRLSELKPSSAIPYIQAGQGTQTIFVEMLKFLSLAEETFRVRDILNDIT